MKTTIVFATLVVASAAQAEAPKNALLVDHSVERLIDAKAARAVFAEGIPARVWKLYPASKWGWASQVEGGITGSGTCVVTARAMIAPLTATRKLLFTPEKMATTFDAVPGATAEQCRQVARDKLKEAVEAVVSSLVKSG
ncbi:MAG: hypothetical protein U1E89_02930 [Burkholderiaceae bacterium]